MKDGDAPGRDADGLRIEDDVRREIRSHLEMRVEELVASGVEPEAALEEARRRFGDEERLAREAEAVARRTGAAERRARALDGLGQDVVYALRSLVRSPAFAAVAILTLALGIGANAGIFSVVRGVLLRPLPLPDPDGLVWIAETRDGGSATMHVAWPNVVDWREQASSFEGLAPFGAGEALVLGGERPQRAGLARMGVDFWRVFPLRPVEGRLTTADDHRQGVEPVAVVGDRFWRAELGSRPVGDLVLEVGGYSVRVVGVLPPGFDFPSGTDLWVPAELEEPNTHRTAHNWQVVARLGEGVTVARADEELDAITRAVLAGSPDDPQYLADGARVVALRDRVVGNARRPLLLLLGAAAFVLLVACTNLASTLLARGAARSREMAVRASLGAGRGRLVRQLLTESLVLSTLGAAAGLALAVALGRWLQVFHPSAVPRLEEIRLDGTVVAFTAAVTVVTAALFGLLPALRLSDERAGDALRAGSRGNAFHGRGPLWRMLVGTEVALALVLLTGSGLLVRSFRQVLSEEAGVDPEDVLVVDVDLSQLAYPEAADHAAFHGRLLERLAALPGVRSAAVATAAPLARSVPNGRMELDGDLDKHADGGYVAASPGLFDALDVPLERGRGFDERDGSGAPHVAIVSRSFADTWWPGEDPIGRQVTGGGMDDLWQERTFSTVVGVVGDVRYRELSAEPVPTVYFPIAQRPFRLRWSADLLVEAAAGDPAALSAGVRAVVRELDPDAAVRMRPMRDLVSDSVADRRFTVVILGGFALLALVLALVGIYGVVSYSVVRRTREMGIRLALGASPGAVRGLVLRESLVMVLGGLVVGTAGALALTGLLAGLLYEVSATDPVTFASMVALLGGAALVATWVPARAGTRVDPMVTMRAE